MSPTDLPLIAGTTSTAIFVVSYLPMIGKAVKTKDLSSYSGAQLLLTNLGNAVYSLYVYNLPFGPIWLLHTFYVVSSALMLAWYVRYAARRRLADLADGSRTPCVRLPRRPMAVATLCTR